MLEFMINNLAVILWVIFAILVIILIVFTIRTGNYSLLMKLVNTAVNAAEAKWGSGTGSIKYVEASTYINNMLPWYLRIVFTPTFIDKLIETVVEGLQKATTVTVPIMTVAIMPVVIKKDGV